MAKYLYVGPPEARGVVPTFGFDDGILDPSHLATLLERGHVRDLTVPLPPEPEPVEPTEDTVEKPLIRMNKAELQAVAAGLGISTDGTNRELVARISAARE